MRSLTGKHLWERKDFFRNNGRFQMMVLGTSTSIRFTSLACCTWVEVSIHQQMAPSSVFFTVTTSDGLHSASIGITNGVVNEYIIDGNSLTLPNMSATRYNGFIKFGWDLAPGTVISVRYGASASAAQAMA